MDTNACSHTQNFLSFPTPPHFRKFPMAKLFIVTHPSSNFSYNLQFPCISKRTATTVQYTQNGLYVTLLVWENLIFCSNFQIMLLSLTSHQALLRSDFFSIYAFFCKHHRKMSQHFTSTCSTRISTWFQLRTENTELKLWDIISRPYGSINLKSTLSSFSVASNSIRANTRLGK